MLNKTGIDYHTHTYKTNKEFRKRMNRLTWFTWHFWRKSIKRQYAKTWNHAKAYGSGKAKAIFFIDT